MSDTNPKSIDAYPHTLRLMLAQYAERGKAEQALASLASSLINDAFEDNPDRRREILEGLERLVREIKEDAEAGRTAEVTLRRVMDRGEI